MIMQCALTVFLAFILSGCAIKDTLRFDVTVNNVGDRDLEEVKTKFPNFYFPSGTLSHKMISSYSLYSGEVPKEATVSWRFPGERPYMPDHVVTIAIPSNRSTVVHGDLKYDLTFDLNGETVVPHWVIHDYTWMKDN